jgi:hypothetical protein
MDSQLTLKQKRFFGFAYFAEKPLLALLALHRFCPVFETPISMGKKPRLSLKPRKTNFF